MNILGDKTIIALMATYLYADGNRSVEGAVHDARRIYAASLRDDDDDEDEEPERV